MLNIVFVRHGQPEGTRESLYYGFTDYALSGEGLRQAEATAQMLRAESFDVIYSSPLQRAQQTARIIADAQEKQVPFQLDERLREINFGDYEGYSFAQIKSENPAFAKEIGLRWLNTTFPGGESAYDLFERVDDFFKDLLFKYNEGKFLIVAHDGSIRTALCSLLHLTPDTYWRFRTKYCSVTRVDCIDGYGILQSFNL